MANPYFQLGEQRAAKVNRLFGLVAGRYDLINDLQSAGMHRLWKRQLVRFAQLKPGDLVLDVCCGTGDVARRLVERSARVVAVDFSSPMLEVARQRLSQGGGVRWPIQFARADAMRLPVLDESADAVTISYGLRNLADVRQGLSELWRVLKPGGRLLVLDFGKPSNPVWRGAYFAYLRWAVPVLGRCFAGSADAYSYILESLRHYPAQEGVALLLNELGSRNGRVVNLLGGIMSINYAEK